MNFFSGEVASLVQVLIHKQDGFHLTKQPSASKPVFEAYHLPNQLETGLVLS